MQQDGSGVIESTREYEVVIDTHGIEHPYHEQEYNETPNIKRQGSAATGARQACERSRSRTPRERDDRDAPRHHHRGGHRSGRRSHQSTMSQQPRTPMSQQPRTPIRDRERAVVERKPVRDVVPPRDEVTISTMELQELLDGLNRSVRATNSLADMCHRAAEAYRGETRALEASKFLVERFD